MIKFKNIIGFTVLVLLISIVSPVQAEEVLELDTNFDGEIDQWQYKNAPFEVFGEVIESAQHAGAIDFVLTTRLTSE